MNDEQLVEKVAEIWVENGGDANGLDYLYLKLKKRIEELYTNKSK